MTACFTYRPRSLIASLSYLWSRKAKDPAEQHSAGEHMPIAQWPLENIRMITHQKQISLGVISRLLIGCNIQLWRQLLSSDWLQYTAVTATALFWLAAVYSCGDNSSLLIGCSIQLWRNYSLLIGCMHKCQRCKFHAVLSLFFQYRIHSVWLPKSS